jgi:hypothetical protein
LSDVATIISPYRNGQNGWLRGNLHTHTTNSDGPLSPQETIDVYAAKGYDFLMLADHDQLSPVNMLDSRGLTMIPGNEITAMGVHLIHVNASVVVPPQESRQNVLDEIGRVGGFAVMCHPNWERTYNHCPQPLLEQLQGYAGIEIFNGVTRRAEGNPYATDRWDMLLSQGRSVWGFAHDDCHKPEDMGIAWNMVQSQDRSVPGIVDALRSGRFYASTGVEIRSIEVEGRAIRIETRNADRIAFCSNDGRRQATLDGKTAEFTVPESPRYTYLRVECWGAAEQMAWTQPFLLPKYRSSLQ